jgi:hypothetical protein
MKKLSIILGLALAMCVSAGAQNRSVYTSTNTKACRTIESNPDEAGWYRGRCKGVGGYTLELTEGDLRQNLIVITPGKKEHDLQLTSYYPRFSAVGEKVEWRVKKGVPVALIARYNVSKDDEGGNISYLMISKIGKKESCVVDVIEPGSRQNERARDAADAAAGKPCKTMALD